MRKPKHEIRHGHMEWTGNTVAEVRAARDETLERLFRDYRTTTLIPMPLAEGETVPGVCVIEQDHDGGWSYMFYRVSRGDASVVQNMERVGRGSWRPVVQNMERGGGTCGGPSWSREDAEDHARRHLAQMAYRDAEHNGSEYLTPGDMKGRQEHAGWCEFQRQYAAARAAGLPDNEAHAKACGRAGGEA